MLGTGPDVVSPCWRMRLACSGERIPREVVRGLITSSEIHVLSLLTGRISEYSDYW
jgi:hypothetical protein